MSKILIAIARQFGSGGSTIGTSLAKRLGFRYFDREILRRTTDLLGAEEHSLSAREEKLSGFLEEVLRSFILGSPETAYVPPPIRPVYDEDLFETESGVIRKIAETFDSVIVGRAATFVLSGKPGLVNVFLHAPREFRAKRIMEVYHMSDLSEAQELVDKSDYERAKYVKGMTGADWTNANNYHLSVDTEKTGFTTAEEMIALLVGEVKNKLEVEK
jgi:cytidylate kinase